MKSNKSIVFMGTSDFSLKALVALCETGFNIAAVYTRPPKPFGRNYQIQKSLVHQFAENKNIPVYCPKNFKTQEEVEFFRSLNVDLAIVASYGLIIPQSILEIPPHGFINIHASLLPRWRGAAPIQAAILAGDKETGITIMKMDDGIDTGDIISMESVIIFPKTTHEELSNQLGNLGAKMIVETLQNFDQIIPQARKQPEKGSVYAPKIEKKSCRIDWTNSVDTILRQVMAFSPIPGAWTEISGIRVKILDAEIENHEKINSSVGILDKSAIVSCGIGNIKLITVQPSGKNRMSGVDFIKGRKHLIRCSFQ
ncbi:MAG: methionyl-tRNA formyltransferase [Holosporaceae bacterium]|jgi:methionyl-tRNA formyltransferase|nr:methionyl-tRNA formyltransferase [Holosporaceae bacterium]